MYRGEDVESVGFGTPVAGLPVQDEGLGEVVQRLVQPPEQSSVNRSLKMMVNPVVALAALPSIATHATPASTTAATVVAR